MREQVVGFLFSEDRSKVVLLIKNRPDWQAGKVNGPGGAVLEGETPLEAMERKFLDETGMVVKGWESFIQLEDQAGNERVHFFHATGDVTKVATARDEYVGVYNVDRLPANAVPNLSWLIPLASLGVVRGVLVSLEERACT